jgi:hypothetical protein
MIRIRRKKNATDLFARWPTPHSRLSCGLPAASFQFGLHLMTRRCRASFASAAKGVLGVESRASAAKRLEDVEC